MTGVEFLEAARRLDPLAQARHPDGLRRHRSGHRRHQPGRGQPLHPETVGSPRGEAVPAPRRRTRSPGGAPTAPTFGGIRVIGDRWSASTHRIKELLARNQVPYQAIDAGGPEGQMLLDAVGVSTAQLPVVLLEGGGKLIQPSLGELAEAVNLHTRPQLETYDLVIVGAGPGRSGRRGLRRLRRVSRSRWSTVKARGPGEPKRQDRKLSGFSGRTFGRRSDQHGRSRRRRDSPPRC